MMLKNKKEQSMDALVLLRKGNKISAEEDIKTMCGTDSEGKPTLRLPDLVVNPSHKIQTLLLMPTDSC